jgi:EmrB/QacA subfamily drug resistance transporter
MTAEQSDAPPTDAGDHDDGHPRKWMILVVMCTCVVLVVAGVSSLNIAIPSIIAALEPTNTETLWIISAYALVFAGLLLPAGALGDRYGRKGALLVGLVIFVGASLWSAWSSDPTSLIAARGTMGVGAALIMPATLSIIVHAFPVRERGKAIAMWAGFAGAGASLGVIAGGILLESFWWGSVFLINVPIAIVAGTLIITLVPTSRDEGQTPLDPIGGLLSIAGLGSLIYAIIEGGEVGWGEGSTIAWFAASAVLLTGWVRWELAAPNAMLDPRTFKRTPFSLGSLALTTGFGVMFGLFFIITQYFQFVQGHSPLSAAVRSLPFAITMIIVAPRAPAVAARIGARGAIAMGSTLQAVGFVVVAFAGADTSYWAIVPSFVLMAGGMAILMPPSSEAIVSSLPPSKAGVGSAWNDSTREIGAALGIAVLGTFLGAGYRSGIEDSTESLPPELAEAANEGIGATFRVADQAGLPELIEPARQAFVDGMSTAFWIAAAVSLAVGGVVASTYPRKGNEPTPVEDEPVSVA